MHLDKNQTKKFLSWLADCGAEILEPMSEWEIARVRANGNTHVAYTNSKGRQTWPKPLRNMLTKKSENIWPKLGNPQQRVSGNKKALIDKLGKRDGFECWYCAHPLAPPNRDQVDGEMFATVEEICPRQIGGPTHIGNQVLACNDCNQLAGNKSVSEKVSIREEKRHDHI